MHTITLIAYLLAVLFLIILIRAVFRVLRDNRIQKKIISKSPEINARRKELKQQGLKEFTFNNGKVKIFAKSFKDANARYQERKELYNLK